MSTPFYNSAGVLVLDQVTPVIKALFGELLLGKLAPGSREVSIGATSTREVPTWKHIFSELRWIAADRGFTVPATAPRRLIVEALSQALNCSIDPLLTHFDEVIRDSSGCPDPSWQQLVAFAIVLNDGHGLTALKLEGSWYSDELRRPHCGGEGLYISAEFCTHFTSGRTVSVATGVQEALQRKSVYDAAAHLALATETLLSGVLRDEVRREIRHRLSYLLSLPPASEWHDNSPVRPNARLRAFLSTASPSVSVTPRPS